jgi:LysM repeat protein
MSTLQAELGNIATQTAAAGGGGTLVATPTPVTTAEGQAPESGGEATSLPPPETTEEPTSEPEATVVVYTATPGIPKNYTIQGGEFPFCIARRFDVDVGELLSLNGLSTNSLVPVGFSLKIPQTGNGFNGQRALRKHPTDYTVVSGDTIYSVACLFGSADPAAIIQANNLKKPYSLTPGKTIYIP